MKQLFNFFGVTNTRQKCCRVSVPVKIYNSLYQQAVIGYILPASKLSICFYTTSQRLADTQEQTTTVILYCRQKRNGYDVTKIIHKRCKWKEYTAYKLIYQCINLRTRFHILTSNFNKFRPPKSFYNCYRSCLPTLFKAHGALYNPTPLCHLVTRSM